jgi:uncharacterized membrane protein required for colicin V production
VTSFDFYFLGILLAFTVGGFLSGFISKLFGLLGLIASIWAGLRFGIIAEPLFAGLIKDSMVRSLLASTFASLIVYALVLVFGGVLAKAVRSSVIAPVDRMFGLLIGAAQAVVVIGLGVLVGQQFKLDQKDWWRKAVFRHSADEAAQLLDRTVDFKTLADRWIDADLRRKIDDSRGETEGLLGEMGRSPKPLTE